MPDRVQGRPCLQLLVVPAQPARAIAIVSWVTRACSNFTWTRPHIARLHPLHKYYWAPMTLSNVASCSRLNTLLISSPQCCGHDKLQVAWLSQRQEKLYPHVATCRKPMLEISRCNAFLAGRDAFVSNKLSNNGFDSGPAYCGNLKSAAWPYLGRRHTLGATSTDRHRVAPVADAQQAG